MFTLSRYLDQLTHPRPPFTIEGLVDFPSQEWNRNLIRYSELESWYDGSVLDETVERQGKEIEVYPVKINPIPNTVEKHTYFLFGQVEQDERPLVYPKITAPDLSDDAQVKSAKALEDLLYRVWSENNGRATQWTGGAQSNTYGGCVFRVDYDPFDPLKTVPIRIDIIHPKFFLGIPDGTNLWKLREAWIIRPINHAEAKEFGVTVAPDIEPWMSEHYTKSSYECLINGDPAYRFLKGDWVPLSGENIFGFVPVVYIPHIRVWGFYGETFIENVQGIVKELNLRAADYGDAVTTDAHSYLGMKNVAGAPTVLQIAPGLYAINMKSAPDFTGQAKDPDLFEIRKPSASAPMENLVDLLYEYYRRAVNVPAVVEGEDEGSQRSGLTLVTRMISLVSHTDTERIFWTTGLNLLTRMVIKILLVKNVDQVFPEHLTFPIRQEWAPVLPRDREVIVNEVVALMGAKLGSINRLLEVLGVENPKEERGQILEDLKEITETEAEATAKAQPPQMPQSSSSAAKGTPAREKNTKKE